ncbi:hypothetical protein OPV22_028427 [Ensete ventricosum]|uniref:Uncharacterized protein n=1 Tax=Ensete ventricosum TaxID=4639 RepID=A0AAV8QAF8_ENSVE|nr:hypothetical protein OPV22_028427 [Ensete ventricosum]
MSSAGFCCRPRNLWPGTIRRRLHVEQRKSATPESAFARLAHPSELAIFIVLDRPPVTVVPFHSLSLSRSFLFLASEEDRIEPANPSLDSLSFLPWSHRHEFRQLRPS